MVELVVEPHRDAANALGALVRHALEALLEVLLGVVAQGVLAEDFAIRVHEVVRATDDNERTVLEALEARVERRMPATRVQHPPVRLLRLDGTRRGRVRAERLGVGTRGA